MHTAKLSEYQAGRPQTSLSWKMPQGCILKKTPTAILFFMDEKTVS